MINFPPTSSASVWGSTPWEKEAGARHRAAGAVSFRSPPSINSRLAGQSLREKTARPMGEIPEQQRPASCPLLSQFGRSAELEVIDLCVFTEQIP